VDGYLVGIDGSVAAADRASVERALRENRLLWLDLHGVDEDTAAMLRDTFEFHPVALTDVSEFGQRPKGETFGDTLYLVGYSATSALGELVEVHSFYSERYLITVRKADCPALDAVRAWIGASGGQAAYPNRPLRLITLHRIMDAMTDSYFAPLSELDDRIDSLTERIFDNPAKDELSDLLSMQRWLVGLRKLVTPQRDVLAGLLSGVVELPGKDDAADPYLRDLYDHVIRISDLIDSYRDLLSNAMDAYLSMVSNKLNEVMKQLTVIATVFLPLSFLTGFFGQNFAWLVGRMGGLATFLLLGIGTEVLAVAGLYWLFRRRGWL
jgi:magnesium transporter